MFETPPVDLGTPVSEGMAVWASGPKPRIERVAWAAADGVTGTEIQRMSMHTGTHIDAPAHFIPGGKWIDDYPIEKFSGEGVAVDISHLQPRDPITRETLVAFEDDIHDGDVVMCYTGWSDRRGLTSDYLFEFPYLTEGAGEYLCEREAHAVGVDTLSVGGFTETLPNQDPVAETPVDVSHVTVLENDILPIEVVDNLDGLLDGRRSRRAFFDYAPIRFVEVEASPTRPVAYPMAD